MKLKDNYENVILISLHKADEANKPPLENSELNMFFLYLLFS